MAKSSARDKSGGAMQVIAGRAKEAFGALTGRTDRRSQGQVGQMKGAAKNKRGHLKGRLR
jgi:uncharacterized protein YjbJ (UPF0337 family)